MLTDEALSLGNINHSSFIDIWQSERFARFRRMFKDRGGLLPICSRCCQLTEY
jgi:MoaA/NifB/PqqE/SkfB family radical SAM enzyme